MYVYIYIYIYICLSVILLDSSFRTAKNCNLQVLLEECKCVIKDNKNDKYIIDDVEVSPDSDEERLLEKIQMEKNSDYQENFDAEILKQLQMEKRFDQKTSDKENFSKEN